MRWKRSWVGFGAILAGCGGGGGSSPPAPPAPPPPQTVALAVKVELAGDDAAVSISNGEETLTAAGAGSSTLTFAKPQVKGSDYTLAITGSPFASCTATNGNTGKAGETVPEVRCTPSSGVSSAMPRQVVSFATHLWMGYSLDARNHVLLGHNISAEYETGGGGGTAGEPGYGPNQFYFNERSAIARNVADDFTVLTDTCNGVVRMVAFAEPSRKFDVLAGAPLTQCGRNPAGLAPRDGHAGQAILLRPGPVAVAADHAVWVAEDRPNVLRRISPEADVTTVALVSGMADGSLPGMITSLAVLDAGETIVLTSADALWQVQAGRARRLSGPDVTSPQRVQAGSDGKAYFYDQGLIKTIALDGVTASVGEARNPQFALAGRMSFLPLDTVVYGAIPISGPDKSGAPVSTQFAVQGKGYLVYADAQRHALVRLTKRGDLDGAEVLVATEGEPQTVLADATGRLWFVEKRDDGHGMLRTAAGDGSGVRDILAVSGDVAEAQLALAADGRIGLALPRQGEVRLYDQEGAVQRRVLAADLGSAALVPEGAVFDSTGNFYFLDRQTLQVQRVAPGGAVAPFAGTRNTQGSITGPLGAARFAAVGPASLTVDAEDNLYLSGQGRVRKITPDGVTSLFQVDWSPFSESFFAPAGIVAAGGYLYGIRPGYGYQRTALAP